MPVSTETDICTLRIGSTVSETGDVSDVEANPGRAYGFSKTGYFFLPEVSMLGGIVSITLRTGSGTDQLPALSNTPRLTNTVTLDSRVCNDRQAELG